MKHSQGFSLIELMITVAILGVVMMGMAGMLATQNRESSAVVERLAAVDFQNLLQTTFADGSVCAAMLLNPTPVTFDSTNAFAGSTNPPVINLPNTFIPASAAPGAPPIATVGQPVSPLSSKVVVQTAAPAFQIAKIQGSGNIYTAVFQVHYDSNKLLRSLKPASVSIVLQTTNVGTLQTVKGCRTSSMAPSGGCQQYLKPSTGAALGIRNCWGAFQDNGTTLACLNGTAPVLIGTAADDMTTGETTTNGVDLYTACDGLAPAHACHVSTYYCF